MELEQFFESLEDEEITQLFGSSSPTDEPKNTNWSWEENKLFENALAEFNLDSPDLFANIASKIPGKTIDDIKQHYEALVEDLNMIESGAVPLPDYKTTDNHDEENSMAQKKSAKKKKKNPKAWTKEEHQNFLIGLEMYGKGDWKSISRFCVKTRNSAQVASHAQKYFLKHNKASTSAIPENNAVEAVAIPFGADNANANANVNANASVGSLAFYPHRL